MRKVHDLKTGRELDAASRRAQEAYKADERLARSPVGAGWSVLAGGIFNTTQRPTVREHEAITAVVAVVIAVGLLAFVALGGFR